MYSHKHIDKSIVNDQDYGDRDKKNRSTIVDIMSKDEEDDNDEDWAEVEEEPTEMLNGALYVGGEYCAKNDVRKKFGITHVLTCVSLYEETFPPDEDDVRNGKWLIIRLADAATSDLLSHLESATAFVQKTIEGGGKIAVHSLEGVSRAASIVIAYLMKYRSMTLKRAFEIISKQRPDVRVNRGFWRQLHAYEFYVKGKNSIDESDLPGAIIFEADAMAAIIKRFRDAHPKPLVEHPSPRVTFLNKIELTGGSFCGSPRKSKQPHTPRPRGRLLSPTKTIISPLTLDSAVESPRKKSRIAIRK